MAKDLDLEWNWRNVNVILALSRLWKEPSHISSSGINVHVAAEFSCTLSDPLSAVDAHTKAIRDISDLHWRQTDRD